ncbi:MAG: hypothetical protein HY719_15080 [Planctomycetes bacterium]|nr:hypothetical protein [Planctomycetota bacterium]
MFRQLLAYAQPALIIENLDVAESPPPVVNGGPEAPIAKLRAKPGGLIAWFLSLIGLGKTSTLTLTNRRVTRVDKSNSSEDTSEIPLGKITSTHRGWKKPSVLPLIVGALLFLVGIIYYFVGGRGSGTTSAYLVVAGLVGILKYILSKRFFYVVFASDGGTAVSLKVKAGGDDVARMITMCERMESLVRGSG